MRAWSKHKARRLYADNIRVVACYGFELHFLNDRELRQAWRLAASCLSLAAPGRSAEAFALTNASAIGCLPFALVLHWSGEVWKTACGLDPLAICLPDLSWCFRLSHAAGIPTSWIKVRWPMAGAALQLRRIGGRFAQLPDVSLHPYALISDLGVGVCLTRTSPARPSFPPQGTQGPWRASSTASGKRALSLRTCSLTCSWLMGRCSQPRSGMSLCCAYFMCHSVWTRERLVTVDLTCLCHAAPSSIRHMLWESQHFDVVRGSAGRGRAPQGCGVGLAALW